MLLTSTTDEDFVICTETSDMVSTIVESLVVFPSLSSPLSDTSEISPLPAGVDPTTVTELIILPVLAAF